MKDITKLIATAIIWGMITIILSFSRYAGDGSDMIWLTFIMGGAATLSTMAIWRYANHREETEVQQRAVKGKRTNRASRLVEGMDEDELLDMEEFLAARREDRLSGGR
jgi:hypothetical protein